MSTREYKARTRLMSGWWDGLVSKRKHNRELRELKRAREYWASAISRSLDMGYGYHEEPGVPKRKIWSYWHAREKGHSFVGVGSEREVWMDNNGDTISFYRLENNRGIDLLKLQKRKVMFEILKRLFPYNFPEVKEVGVLKNPDWFVYDDDKKNDPDKDILVFFERREFIPGLNDFQKGENEFSWSGDEQLVFHLPKPDPLGDIQLFFRRFGIDLYLDRDKHNVVNNVYIDCSVNMTREADGGKIGLREANVFCEGLQDFGYDIDTLKYIREKFDSLMLLETKVEI